MQVGGQNKPRDARRVLFSLSRFAFCHCLSLFLRVGTEIRFLSPFFPLSLLVRGFV